MKIIVCNYDYYFQTMAHEVSEKQNVKSAMFDRLKEKAKQKLSKIHTYLNPDQIEKISDDFIGSCIKHLCSNMQSVQRIHLDVFENECINSLEKDLLLLIQIELFSRPIPTF